METENTNGLNASYTSVSKKKEGLGRQLDRMTGEGGPSPHADIRVTAPFWETKNTLSEAMRVKTVETLQTKLAESLDLFGRVKNAHWNVKSPQFIALHKLLDEISAECLESSDLIAERIAQLGGTAQGSLQQSAKNSTLPLHELSSINGGRDYLDSVSHALSSFSDSLRNALSKIEPADPVTIDILTGIARGVDKNLWFVEAHTQKKTADTCN